LKNKSIIYLLCTLVHPIDCILILNVVGIINGAIGNNSGPDGHGSIIEQIGTV
jgi:hypothetical protein